MALLKEAISQGLQLYENTRVVGVHEDAPCRIETDRGTVRAADVFVAANVPVNNRVLLHTKIAAYRSYAIAAVAPSGLPAASSGTPTIPITTRALTRSTDRPI